MLMRHIARLIAVCAALLAAQTADAHLRAIQIATVNSQLLLSLGQSDLEYATINWMKTCAGPKFNTGSSPASLDANGYPNISAPGATIFYACLLPTLTQYSGTWEIGFSGTGEIAVQGPSITVTSDPQSCSQGAGVISGTNCDVTFNFGSNPAGATLQFNSGHTFSGMNSAFLIRSTDKTAFLAGQIWTPEFISAAQNTKPLLIRTMGMTFAQQALMAPNSSAWAYRTPLGAFSYAGNPTWFPNLWSASITGTDQYTASGATDTPVSWTDREMLQGNFPNASAAALSATAAANNGSGAVRLTVSSSATLTTNQQILLQNVNGLQNPPTVWTITVIDATHIDLQGSTFSASWNPTSGSPATIVTSTINIASRGAKFIVGSGILGAPGITAGQNGTLVYDATLAVLGTSPTTAVGAMVYTSNGVEAGVPIEAQVNLANTLGVPLWFNIPPYYQAASVTSLASYVCGAANQTPYVEYNNENWNFLFAAQWFTQHGLGLGLALGSNQALYSTIGLYYRQLMAAATSACPAIHRINGAQAHNVASQFDTLQFQGQLLCGTSCGNSLYQNFVGTDFNVLPNRPIDYTDDITIATYFAGAQENGNNGTLTQINGTCNGVTCTGIIAASACFASPSNITCGTGGTSQLALNFVDSDTRNGTFTDGTGGTSTAFGLQASTYAGWNAVAVSENKALIAYEGGYGGFSPSASYLTSIGDSNASADATNINNLIIAYRSSSLFDATYQFWNQQWFSNSKVVGNSNLQLEGPAGGGIAVNANYWGLMVDSYLVGTLYQNYHAVCTINHSLAGC